jgi:prepilin-type N-terminal cleavage/methylation domain-containing protein
MKIKNKWGSLRDQRGFTLIEMLIVVAIVGILVAVSVPALNTAKTDSMAAKKAAISSAAETAKTRYALNNNVAGQDALFSEFGPYMVVNGETPSETDLTLATNNGTGQNITDWGTYTDSTGDADPIVWSGDPLPIVLAAFVNNMDFETDFNGQDLSLRDYTNSEWHQSTLTNTNLSNNLFTDSEFHQVALNGANMSGAAFTNAVFHQGSFDGTTLTGATFQGTTFHQGNFTNSNVTAEQLAKVGQFFGPTVLTGTGITQNELETAWLAEGKNLMDLGAVVY